MRTEKAAGSFLEAKQDLSPRTLEPEPPREKKPRVKRIDGLEAEVTLVRGQMEREEDDD